MKPDRNALREAHLELLATLLDSFLWKQQSEMLFVGLFQTAGESKPLRSIAARTTTSGDVAANSATSTSTQPTVKILLIFI